MDDMIYLKTICADLRLGSLLSVPEKVASERYYKVFRVTTESGTFDIKMLNNSFVKKANNFEIINKSQELIKKLSSFNIPIIMPLEFHGKYLQSIEKRYFYIYPVIKGSILNSDEVSFEKIKMLSSTLRKIHNIESFEDVKEIKPYLHIRWRKYLRLAEHKGSSISQVLSENIKTLEHLTELCNNSLNKLPNNIAITYNNLNCHSVIWTDNFFTLLNPELLKYGNPYIEALNVCLIWSGLDNNTVDFNTFSKLLKEYFKIMPKLLVDWEVIYNVAYKEKLLDVEDDIKKSLFIDCHNENEQLEAEIRIKTTIHNLLYFHNIKEDVLKKLK